MAVVFDKLHGDTVDLVKGLYSKSECPWLARAVLIATGVTVLIIVLLLGYATGYLIQTSGKGIYNSFEAIIPDGYLQSNQTCPPLEGEFLITNLTEGQSFEGLVVTLACKDDHLPFPTSVMCRKKSLSATGLEWSHLPVCYPKSLLDAKHWVITPMASQVSCNGDYRSTECQMSCHRNYVPVEEQLYLCKKSPCPAWTIGSSGCYMCDRKCDILHESRHTQPLSMIESLGCSCDKIVVTSEGSAANWQSTSMGLYYYVGEHNGRPLFWNKATHMYMYYYLGAEWLIGATFSDTIAGIQVIGTSNRVCPEKWGDLSNKTYVDYSRPLVGGSGEWISDSTISAQCLNSEINAVNCYCKVYKMSNAVKSLVGPLPENETRLDLSGEYMMVNDSLSLGFLAPVYQNKEKSLYLFSHHHKGLVWQIGKQLNSVGDLRGPEVFPTSAKMSVSRAQ